VVLSSDPKVQRGANLRGGNAETDGRHDREIAMEGRWGPEFQVGLPLIDDAHQRQAELIDSIEKATAPGGSPEAVQELLLQLVEHTSDHFATEQQLMRAIGFPYFDAHVEEHSALLEHISTLLASHSAGYHQLTNELARRLAPWLLDHVQTSDRLLGRYLLRVGWPQEARFVKTGPNEPSAAQAAEHDVEDRAREYSRQQTEDRKAQLRVAQAFEIGLGAYRDGAFPWECPHFESPEETAAWRAGWYSEADRHKP
jgi:hemerythrin-like metal-binding protein